MNLLEELKNKVNKKIQNASWIERDSMKILEIEVDEPILDKLTEISKSISKFLDNEDISKDEYFLEVLSMGTEKKVDFIELDKYIGKNLKITLNKELKNIKVYQGQLLLTSKEELEIEWNAKGQFRKQRIEKSLIDEISLSAKIKKEKRK